MFQNDWLWLYCAAVHCSSVSQIEKVCVQYKDRLMQATLVHHEDSNTPQAHTVYTLCWREKRCISYPLRCNNEKAISGLEIIQIASGSPVLALQGRHLWNTRRKHNHYSPRQHLTTSTSIPDPRFSIALFLENGPGFIYPHSHFLSNIISSSEGP